MRVECYVAGKTYEYRDGWLICVPPCGLAEAVKVPDEYSWIEDVLAVFQNPDDREAVERIAQNKNYMSVAYDVYEWAKLRLMVWDRLEELGVKFLLDPIVKLTFITLWRDIVTFTNAEVYKTTIHTLQAIIDEENREKEPCALLT